MSANIIIIQLYCYKENSKCRNHFQKNERSQNKEVAWYKYNTAIIHYTYNHRLCRQQTVSNSMLQDIEVAVNWFIEKNSGLEFYDAKISLYSVKERRSSNIDFSLFPHVHNWKKNPWHSDSPRISSGFLYISLKLRPQG